jgi:hypothetical protein
MIYAFNKIKKTLKFNRCFATKYCNQTLLFHKYPASGMYIHILSQINYNMLQNVKKLSWLKNFEVFKTNIPVTF